MRKPLFIFMISLIPSGCLFAQRSFDDLKGVWNSVISLENNLTENSDHQLKLPTDGKMYLGWGDFIVVEKRDFPNYRICMNGGFDKIVGTYWRNNVLILIVENYFDYGEGTKGVIGVTFIEKDKVYFTLISGTISTPLYFGKDNIYIRAPEVSPN